MDLGVSGRRPAGGSPTRERGMARAAGPGPTPRRSSFILKVPLTRKQYPRVAIGGGGGEPGGGVKRKVGGREVRGEGEGPLGKGR